MDKDCYIIVPVLTELESEMLEMLEFSRTMIRSLFSITGNERRKHEQSKIEKQITELITKAKRYY